METLPSREKAEYAPAGLIALALVEWNAAPPLLVWLLGLALLTLKRHWHANCLAIGRSGHFVTVRQR